MSTNFPDITTADSERLRTDFLKTNVMKKEEAKPKNLFKKDTPKNVGEEEEAPAPKKRARAAPKKKEPVHDNYEDDEPAAIEDDKARHTIVRKYDAYRNFHKLKGKCGAPLGTRATTDAYKQQVRAMEESLSAQDQMKAAKAVWIITNRGLEGVAPSVPVLNKLNLHGHAENAQNAWGEVQDIWQELVIKYDLFRTGVELRLAMAFTNVIQATHAKNNFMGQPQRNSTDEKSQNANYGSDEDIADALKRKTTKK